jgi:hypothetical protein
VLIINELRKEIHENSPFKDEPVDCVIWEKQENVKANDYNPNKVAPPEMELLVTSISNDGYTQPIVTFEENQGITVIDGFHRNRVGKEIPEINKKIHGYLPITIIRESQTGKADRIASTIRHNRARGKHQISSMSDIVLELKNRNWTNSRISKQLGMDEDEILRLCQITGLAGLFTDEDFSKSWDIEDSEAEFTPLTDEITEEEREKHQFRTVNTSDKNRVFHTFDKWECHKAGFYATTKEGMTKDECEQAYCDFLSDDDFFRETLGKVITEWKHSCEHYLTNVSMNRIAWLGQASACYATGIPHVYRGGFYLLSDKEQDRANKTALEYLNKWLKANNMEETSLDDAMMINKQVNIY